MSQIETLHNPHYSRFKVQGKDRILVKVHKNKEIKTASGLVAGIQQAQDVESTGVVLSLSPEFNSAFYPDVVPGAHIKAIPCTWRSFDVHGDTLAFACAEHVIAVYDSPEDE